MYHLSKRESFGGVSPDILVFAGLTISVKLWAAVASLRASTSTPGDSFPVVSYGLAMMFQSPPAKMYPGSTSNLRSRKQLKAPRADSTLSFGMYTFTTVKVVLKHGWSVEILDK